MHPKLTQYLKLSQFLAQVLGSSYEIVLNDLYNPEASIVHISNAHISGRRSAEGLSSFALKLWYTKAYMDHDYVCNYQSQARSQHILRSSTYFIKDDEGELIGMLCINYDNTRHYDLAKAIISLGHPEDFIDHHLQKDGIAKLDIKERFSESSSALIQEVITNKLKELGLSDMELNQEVKRKWLLQLNFDEKLAIVKGMQESGVFLLKGAVPEVAKALHCSAPSIYRYLTRLNQLSETSNKDKLLVAENDLQKPLV